VHVNQLQLDELYAVLREVKAGGLREEGAINRLEGSPYWVWTAMDPESKLLVVIDVGTRTLEMEQRVVHQVGQVGSPGLRAAVCDGRVPGVYEGVPDALRPLDTTAASPRQRPCTRAVLDAAPWAAVCAGRQAVPAQAPRGGETPGGVRHA
jgi:hypothetical protein